MEDLTPVTKFGGWWAKREDLAYYTSPEYPSGSKVRQYTRMTKETPNIPMIVGCSAGSAMQIYVAAAAKQTGVKGYVYTAARKNKTDATKYALDVGAEVVEIRPGYLSICRLRAKERAKELGKVVRWNVDAALKDAMDQCENIPKDAKRIIVPTGSGLTCSGVLAGIIKFQLNVKKVVAIAVSNMADDISIINNSMKLVKSQTSDIVLSSKLDIIRYPMKYDDWKIAKLPDGTPLDPYYAAKGLEFIEDGDCFWIPGLRPIISMPKECQKEFSSFVPKR